MRLYHAKRFREAYETVKRLGYDEWRRTQCSPQVRAQAELRWREGRKHKHLARLRQPTAIRHGRRGDQSIDRAVRAARWRRTRSRGSDRAVQPDASFCRSRSAWPAGAGAARCPIPRDHANRLSNTSNCSSTISGRSNSGRSRLQATRPCAIRSTRPWASGKPYAGWRKCFRPARQKNFSGRRSRAASLRGGEMETLATQSVLGTDGGGHGRMRRGADAEATRASRGPARCHRSMKHLERVSQGAMAYRGRLNEPVPERQ
jgi:hypothetical protein